MAMIKTNKQIKSQQKDSYTIETLDGPFGTSVRWRWESSLLFLRRG